MSTTSGSAGAWQQLRDDAGGYAALLSALQELDKNRQKIGNISTRQASDLLSAVRKLTDGGSAWVQHSWPPALRLMSRWAMRSTRTVFHSGESGPTSTEILHSTVRWLLGSLSQLDLLPTIAIAAAVQFLGAAYAGCSGAYKEAALAAICDVLCVLRPEVLKEGDALQELCSGVREVLVECLEDAEQFGWLLACLLLLLADAPSMDALEPPAATAATVSPEPDVGGFPAVMPVRHLSLGSSLADQHAFRAMLQGYSVLRHVGSAALQRLARASCEPGPRTAAATAAADTLLSAVRLLAPSTELGGSGTICSYGVSHGLMLLCATGLLEGTAVQVRRTSEVQREVLLSLVGPALGEAANVVRAALLIVPPPPGSPEFCQPGAVRLLSFCQGFAYVRLSAQVATAAIVQVHTPRGEAHPQRAQHLLPAGVQPLAPWLPLAALRFALEHCLSLDGVYAAAARGGTASQANAWLSELSHSSLYQDVGSVARSVLDAIGTPLTSATAANKDVAPPDVGGAMEGQQHLLRHALLTQLVTSCAAASQRYGELALLATPEWLTALDQQLLRDVLDRTFIVAVGVLSALYDAWQPKAMPADLIAGKLATDNCQALKAAAPCADDEPAIDGAKLMAEQEANDSQLSQYQVAQDKPSAHCTGTAVAAAVSGTLPRPLAAVGMLRAVSDLQFCRLPLPAYSLLLQRLVPDVAGVPAACTAALQLLPCYAAMLEHVLGPAAAQAQNGFFKAGVGQQQPQQPGLEQGGDAGEVLPAAQPLPHRWQVDTVLLAKVAFLLPVLTVCTPGCSDLAAALDRVLPPAFLLLQAQQDAPTSAAHGALGSLLAGLCNKGHPELAERALVYYVERSLESPLTANLAQIEGLATGLHLALGAMPSGSSTVLYVLGRLVDICGQWLHLEAAGTGQIPAGLSTLVTPQGQLVDGRGAAGAGNEVLPSPAVKLASIVDLLVIDVDYNLLPEVTDMVGTLLRTVPAAVQPYLWQHVHDSVLRSNDYTRKSRLMRWLHDVAPLNFQFVFQ